MRELEMMVAMMVTEVRESSITIGMLRAQLLCVGVDEEELALLLEVVTLEVSLQPPRRTITVGRAITAYNKAQPDPVG